MAIQSPASFLLINSTMKAGVFFERDGILNLTPVTNRSQVTPLTVRDFHLNKRADGPLRKLKAAGLILLATTNQPGLSRGCQSRRELDVMHALMRQEFGLHDVYTCPHDEADRCPCRKPRPGLFTEAAFKWHLDLEHSFVISDKWQDAEAAHITGCTSLLIRSPWIGDGHHDFVLTELEAAADKVLQLHAQTSGGCARGYGTPIRI